jgi:hypothetical protein
MDSHVRRTFDIAMIALAAVAGLAVVSNLGGPARYLVVLPAALLLPGSAYARFLHPTALPTFLGLAVVLSLAIETVGAMILVWLGWWHALFLGLVVMTTSSAVLMWDVRNISRSQRGSVA